MLNASKLSEEQKELVQRLGEGIMQLQTLSRDITNIVEAEGKSQLVCNDRVMNYMHFFLPFFSLGVFS